MTEATADETRREPTWWAPWVSWRRKRFWALVAVLAYTLGGFFLAPWLVERTLVKHVAETGRTASADELKMNPYLLTLDLRGFTLADADGTDLLTFDLLHVDLETRSLIDWALNFREIRLVGPHLFDERFDGTDTRLIRLATDLSATEAAPSPASEEEEPPPRVIVQHLEVHDARLRFIDRTVDDFEGAVGPVNVEVNDIRTLPDHAGRQAVVVQLNDRDRLQWQGDIQLVPLRSSGQVTFRGDGLPNARRYLQHYLPFDLEFTGVGADFAYAVELTREALEVRVSDFSGNVDGLALLTEGGTEALVTVDGVTAGGGRFDLVDGSAGLDTLDLEGFGAEVVLREDGSLNLLELVPPADEPAAAAPTDDEDPALPLALSLGTLTVSGDGVALEDRSVTPALELGLPGLALELTGIDLEDGTTMPLVLSTDLSSGGTVAFQGAVSAFPEPRAEGRVQLTGVALAVVQPYVNPFARVELATGTVELTADVVHGPEQLLGAAGALVIDDFSVNDALRSERLAAWNRLTLDRFEAELPGTDVSAARLETSELNFEGLYGRLHIAEDRTTNVGDLVVASAADGAESVAAGDAGLPDITLGGIRMENTALDFSDLSLPLPFEAAIRDLDGDISTLATGSTEPAQVDLEGQVNEFGQARIEGEINAWDPTRQTDIRMRFRNLEISRLTPYTVQFAGYAIEEGRMDTDLAYVFEDRKMLGQNNIVIREMRLGDKVDHPDAGSLPLGLAVALLTDAEGVIDLDVPVEGDLDNPEFRIGGVVLQAIGNLITKVVTAPFRLLGNLVGVDSEEFGVLSFEPGRAELSPPDREQLLKLAEAMAQRPELALEVAGVWAPELDRPALQAARLEADMAAWQVENPGGDDELSTARDRRTLEALFAQRFPATPLETVAAEHMAEPPDPGESGDAAPELDATAYLADLRGRLESAIDVAQAEFETLADARAAAVLAGLGMDDAGTPLKVVEAPPIEVDPAEVDAGEDGDVPMELAVSADD